MDVWEDILTWDIESVRKRLRVATTSQLGLFSGGRDDSGANKIKHQPDFIISDMTMRVNSATYYKLTRRVSLPALFGLPLQKLFPCIISGHDHFAKIVRLQDLSYLYYCDKKGLDLSELLRVFTRWSKRQVMVFLCLLLRLKLADTLGWEQDAKICRFAYWFRKKIEKAEQWFLKQWEKHKLGSLLEHVIGWFECSTWRQYGLLSMSVRQMAEQLSLSKETLQRRLHQLSLLGLLRYERAESLPISLKEALKEKQQEMQVSYRCNVFSLPELSQDWLQKAQLSSLEFRKKGMTVKHHSRSMELHAGRLAIAQKEFVQDKMTVSERQIQFLQSLKKQYELLGMPETVPEAQLLKRMRGYATATKESLFYQVLPGLLREYGLVREKTGDEFVLVKKGSQDDYQTRSRGEAEANSELENLVSEQVVLDDYDAFGGIDNFWLYEPPENRFVRKLQPSSRHQRCFRPVQPAAGFG